MLVRAVVLFLIIVFISTMFILIRVALVTLFERVILAVTQLRKGPNKTGLVGIIQPLIDGVKLLHKVLSFPKDSLYLFVILGSVRVLIGIIIVLSCINTIPLHSSTVLNSLFLVLILRLNVYGVLIIGFRRITKYGFIGGIRAAAQRVRYEVRLSLIILTIVLSIQHMSFIC